MFDIAQGNTPQQRTSHSIMPVVLRLRNGVINHHKTKQRALHQQQLIISHESVGWQWFFPWSCLAHSCSLMDLSQSGDWLGWKVQDGFTNRSGS